MKQDEKTALQLAEEEGNTAIVEALSKTGADTEAKEEVRERSVHGESGASRCGSYGFSLDRSCLSKLSV